MGAMLPAVGMYLGLMTCVLYLHVRCREDPSAVWLLHIIQHLLTPDDTPLECLLLFVFVFFLISPKRDYVSTCTSVNHSFGLDKHGWWWWNRGIYQF